MWPSARRFFAERVSPVAAEEGLWIVGSVSSPKATGASCGLAGRLSVAHVPELLTVCAGSRILEPDLTDLMSVDVAGIEALQGVRAKGAILFGTPGYIQLNRLYRRWTDRRVKAGFPVVIPLVRPVRRRTRELQAPSGCSRRGPPPFFIRNPVRPIIVRTRAKPTSARQVQARARWTTR